MDHNTLYIELYETAYRLLFVDNLRMQSKLISYMDWLRRTLKRGHVHQYNRASDYVTNMIIQDWQLPERGDHDA